MDMTELLKTENNAYKRKLQSKSEALAILQNQLLACQQELDQLRRSRGSQHNGQHWQNQQQPNGQHYTNWQSQQQTNQHTPTNDNGDGLKNINATQIRASNVEFANRKLMDENKLLRFDVEDLKQKLNDATNDIKVLRKQQTMMKISGQALEKVRCLRSIDDIFRGYAVWFVDSPHPARRLTEIYTTSPVSLEGSALALYSVGRGFDCGFPPVADFILNR
jgi:Uncharacterized coiled-coil protein (DUF2353).